MSMLYFQGRGNTVNNINDFQNGLEIRPSFNKTLWGFGTCRGLEEEWIERALLACYHKSWKICVAGLEKRHQGQKMKSQFLRSL